MRLIAVGLLAFTALATPAPAVVTPLVRSPDVEAGPGAFALAGGEALLGRTSGRRTRVLAVPVGGGAVVERLRLGAPRGIAVAASAQATAAVALRESPLATQPFAGRPGEALTAVAPLRRARRTRWLAFLPEVSGERIFFAQVRGDFKAARYAVHAPRPGEPATIPLPTSPAAMIAGDLLALAVERPGDAEEDEARRLIVRDWRTGAERWRVDLEDGVESLDVHDDGRVLVGDDGGGVVEVAAGGAGVRRLSADGTAPAYAGDGVVFIRAGRGDEDPTTLAFAAPDGTVRPFGVPAGGIEHVVADERHVLWQANGCLLAAAADAPAQPAIDPGPCPRTEMTFLDHQSQRRLRRDRRIRIALRCVAAPAPGCRGRVALHEDGRASDRRRFAIAAGQVGRVTLRVTRRAMARARREDRGMGGAFFEVRAVTVDPAGRRSVLSDGYALDF